MISAIKIHVQDLESRLMRSCQLNPQFPHTRTLAPGYCSTARHRPDAPAGVADVDEQLVRESLGWVQFTRTGSRQGGSGVFD